jgi:hypothetical protein
MRFILAAWAVFFIVAAVAICANRMPRWYRDWRMHLEIERGRRSG